MPETDELITILEVRHTCNPKKSYFTNHTKFAILDIKKLLEEGSENEQICIKKRIVNKAHYETLEDFEGL